MKTPSTPDQLASAIESLVALGSTKTELEALKKGYDEKNFDDKNVLKKLDEAIGKAK